MRLTFNLPPEVLERLEKLAKEAGRPREFYIRLAILEYLASNGKIPTPEETLEESASAESGESRAGVEEAGQGHGR